MVCLYDEIKLCTLLPGQTIDPGWLGSPGYLEPTNAGRRPQGRFAPPPAVAAEEARPSLTAAARVAFGCSGRDEKTALQPNQKTTRDVVVVRPVA